jgi:proteasome-interacting protein CIC1
MPPKKTAKAKTAKITKTTKAAPKAKTAKSTKKNIEKVNEVIEIEDDTEEHEQDDNIKDDEIPIELTKADQDIIQELKIKDASIKKAITALSNWNKQKKENSSKKDLFEDDDTDIPIYLEVTGNKYFASSKVLKPRMLEVPHSIHDLEDTRVCLFVKDDLFTDESLARIEILKEDQLKNLAQIVTVKDLKTKYKAYEARRKLLSEYDIFLTDSSIANMIPKLLGKIFFESSKFPLTISITERKELNVDKLVKNFNKALKSIGYRLPMGSNMSLRLGMLGQNIENLIENIQTITKFLEKFSIRLIQIKLKDSPSLPLYIADKVYTKNDILKTEDQQTDANKDIDNIPLSIYVEGLKELGFDDEEANKLFGNKRKAADFDDAGSKKIAIVETENSAPSAKKVKKVKK